MNAAVLGHFIMELGRNSLQAAVLVLVVVLVQWASGKRLTPRWRCALWLLVVVRLLVPFSVSSGTSLSNLWPRTIHWSFHPRLAPSLPDQARASVQEVPSAPVSPSRPGLITPTMPRGSIAGPLMEPAKASPVQTGLSKSMVVPEPNHFPPPSSHDTLSEPHVRAQLPEVMSGSHFSWPSWPVIVFLGWLSGTLFILGHILTSSLRLALCCNRLKPLNDPVVLAVLEESCERMRLPRSLLRSGPLMIVETIEVGTPALHGLLHPRLLLPRGFTASFSPGELRFVFLHELAHLKRRDLWMNWIMALLQALHWFNPLIWLAFARWRNDRELACDAMVLEATGKEQKREYGHTILKLLEDFTPPLRTPGLVGILENKSQLGERIGMIKAYAPAPRWSLLATVLIAALAVIGLTDARSDHPQKDIAGTATARASDPMLILELRDGSHVLGQSLDDPLRFHSDSLGDLKLPVADIRSMEFDGNDHPESNGHLRLTATNWDVLDVRFAAPILPIETGFGISQLPVKTIRSIMVAPPATAAGVQPGIPSTAPGSSVTLSNVIQNPSFETPAITTGAACNRYIGKPTNAGWTFVNSVAIGRNGSTLNQYQPVGTTNGAQYACLQGINGMGAAISQTLSNLPDGNYSFTFTASQRCTLGVYTDNTQNQTVTVLVDGTNVGSFTPPDQNWYSYGTAPILLSPGDHTLTFTNLPVPGDASILLDNIGIKEYQAATGKAAPPKNVAFPREADARLTLDLFDGSCLVGKSLEDSILFHSASLGDLKVPVADITSVEFNEESADGGRHAVLRVDNGDLLMGLFVSPTLSVETGFGKSDLPLKIIRSIKVSHVAESAQPSPNFPAGLVALWKGDGNGADSAGTNNAVVPAGVSYALTQVGEGFQFDGNSSGLIVPASPDLDVGAGPGFTLSCWAQPSSPTTRDPLLEWREGTHLWISESGDIGVSKPGCVYANILDTSGNHHRFGSSTALVQAGIPQQVSLTYEKSSGMGSLYYNGKLVASQYLGSFTPKTDTSLSIGERTVPEEVRYQGVINQISIFNRALSAEEIQSLYAAQSTKISIPVTVSGSNGKPVVPSEAVFAGKSNQPISQPPPPSYFGDRTPPEEVK